MGLSLIDLFDNGVEIDPSRPCLVCGDESVSYRGAQRSSYVIADALKRTGVTPGARVAVLAHNAARPFQCVLGALRAGCTWVPVNARNAAAETVQVLSRTDTDILFYGSAFEPGIDELLAKCPRISLAVCIEGEGSTKRPNLETWCAGASAEPTRMQIPDDALATLGASGGTTGIPKGVMTSHRAWAFRIAEVMVRLAHPRPVHLVAAPMTHGAGAGALELMAMGATHVILPSFDPAAVIDAIGRHGVTHLFLPPTALYRLLPHPMAPQGNYGSLRYLMCGGAPVAPERLREALRLFGPALHVGYGGTEFGGGLCWMPGATLLDAIAQGKEERLLSCGRPSPLVQVDIVGENGDLLPPGAPGEVVIRGHTLASGYYKDPEETARAFRNGGFHSGDIGYKDADGFVYISDRKKDMIISGGFNIYPSEIERVLLTHPAVQDCAVVGVPDAEWGEAVKAVVELKSDATVEAATLAQLCRAALAGYKVPKSFEFWPEIPRSPVGKVLKRAVRERFWQGQTRLV
jgi:acyl-CoA synthetase (AMP-forming)/AMP-acid ligase II